MPWKSIRKKTPTVLQMEATECGAAALAMILAYYGRIVPLEELRLECGISRDGSKASNILRAARKYGLISTGYRKEPQELSDLTIPSILFWNFNHFVVYEGATNRKVFINDPAQGPRIVTKEEFDQSFTGVVLTFDPGSDFKKGGQKLSLYKALKTRMKGSEETLLFILFLTLFMVIPGLVIPTFSKIFIDRILVNHLEDWLRPLVLGMVVTALIYAALTWLQKYYLLRLETKISLSSSAKYFYHVFQLPIEFFTQRFGGEIGNRIQINDKVARLITGDLAVNALNLFIIVFYFIIMLQYDVVLSMIGFFIACINLVILRGISRKRVDLNQRLLQDEGKLLGASMTGLQLIETLKAGGSESDFFSLWSGYQAKVVNAEQELSVATQFLSAFPVLLTSVNNVVILGFGALRVMNGYLSMGELVAFQFLMANFLNPVSQLIHLGSKVQEVRGDLNRLDDVLSYAIDPKLGNPDECHIEEDHSRIRLSGHIEIRQLVFGYNRLESPLIVDFSLILKPGSRVALVGSSGCGKSTIARIVSGLYAPWNGEISFDGRSMDEIDRQLFSRSIAVVDQSIFLFEGSVKENLTMWDKTIPEERIIHAAKDACIHEDIAKRMNGYESRMAEGGANFSGGQRQRIEIARALAGNPSILILDEATSALDPSTEKAIDDNLRRRGCSCLIIAHRLSTIKDCDEIIVLDKGEIVQRGTHEQMKEEDGPYRRLVTMN
ncbi:MAG: NHLP family bacteriocin export ABC transporter peptidase/permease/ATPase subunit [Desulfobacteraceae bacterium]|nr:MAG: NHLP family bacteriocin export ABC transporter peptidase/permease/ATPase subunit [Desulfobacteraceae bacterium]